jgi:hypothetical protein
MEKVDKMLKQMRNFSKDIESIRTSKIEMLGIKKKISNG